MIVMLIGSGVIAFIFIMIEWKFAELPMLPARLFKYGRSTNILLFFNIVIGWIFWGNLFVIPLYFQNIRGMSPGQAGLFILPITIAHGLTSALTGIIISIFGHYKPVIVTGAVCWSIAAVAKLWYDQQTPAWMIVIIGILDGVGVGCSLQPGR
jgi:cyanate permease